MTFPVMLAASSHNISFVRGVSSFTDVEGRLVVAAGAVRLSHMSALLLPAWQVKLTRLCTRLPESAGNSRCRRWVHGTP